MSTSEEFCCMLWDYIIARDANLKKESDEKILAAVANYERALGHLDSIFIILCLKIFYTTVRSEEHLQQHNHCITALFWYLQLPVTPKMHLLEDHIVNYFINNKGFGDIAEDEGKRAHSTQTALNCWLSSISNLQKRETIKLKYEAIQINPHIVVK